MQSQSVSSYLFIHCIPHYPPSPQVPEVQQMPCTRRFLCELETIARTSDNYMPKEPEALNGRILEEEVAPEEVDPLAEMQIEAVRALYR